MADTAHSGPAPEPDLRAFLARLKPEELAALRKLLTMPQAATATDGGGGTVTRGLTTPATPPETPAASAPAVPAPDVPGYEIIAEIGRGGMGVVYEARQQGLGRLVALKMIVSGSAAGEQDLARFRAEATVLAQLQHPHIVQVFEVGECTVGTGTNCPYMALEFCPGGSLAAALDGRPWPAEEAAQVVELLARAVHAAHRAGIVHRDLKPANILLAPQSPAAPDEPAPTDVPSRLAGLIPKITDFGLARRIDDEARRTQSGAILGTPEYMSPEQAAGKKDVGPAADTYALGTILYELLTGRPPLRADNALETLLLVAEREPAPPRSLNPAVPRDLETICLKCLRKEPEKRYASAADLADDLRRHLDGEPIRARPPGFMERTNRLVKRRPGIAIACVLFAATLFLLARFEILFSLDAPATRGIGARAFEYVVLPSAALVITFLTLTRFRRTVAVGTALALAGVVAWFVFPDQRPGIDPYGSFLRILAWPGLAALLAGLLPRWRPIVLLACGLGLAGAGSWALDGGSTPFLAGVFHGLLVGVIACVVAWGIQRDRGTCALGAAVGALAGLFLGTTYDLTLVAYLNQSGVGSWTSGMASLYLETIVAFVAAFVAGLVLGQRAGQDGGERRAHSLR
jgi:serine/threonine protein kinase